MDPDFVFGCFVSAVSSAVFFSAITAKMNDRAWERVAVARGCGQYDMDGNFYWVSDDDADEEESPK